MHRVGLGHRRSAPALPELDARLVLSRTPLCPMSRVTPFSHTPTPAGEISRPRTQAVLNARSARSGDRGVRVWASSPKVRERTCFLSSFRPCASLSACGARSARERASRGKNPRAFGRDTARETQPARIIAPHRAARRKLIGFLIVVHKRRHGRPGPFLGLSHHCWDRAIGDRPPGGDRRTTVTLDGPAAPLANTVSTS